MVTLTAALDAATDARRRVTDALQLAALSLEEPGGTIFGDLAAEVETLAAAVRVARAHAHLTGPLDHRAAVLRVHADDETWADVLTTMYLTWSAAATTPRTDAPVPGRHGRISVITTPYTYGTLRRETGLHRRHTGAAAVVEVLPLADGEHGPPADHEIRVDLHCTRTRTTAFTLWHLPTGTSVHVRARRGGAGSRRPHPDGPCAAAVAGRGRAAAATGARPPLRRRRGVRHRPRAARLTGRPDHRPASRSSVRTAGGLPL
ncbi:hypothetical protein JCM9534A_66130 [Catenuloplanes indicus JCM 9534]